MKASEKGVLNTSTIFFHTPSNLAKSMFFYLNCAGHFFCNEDYLVKRDSYDSILLMYCKKGKGTISYNGKVYTASEGDIVLLDCKHPHMYYTNAYWETLWMHFDGNISQQFFDLIYEYFGVIITSNHSYKVLNIMQKIIDGYNKSTPIPEALVSSYIHRLLTELLLTTSIENDEKYQFDGLGEVIHYIDKNYKQKINLEKLAEIACLSRFYFCKVFKKKTSYTPYEYILTVRLNHAKRFLKNTNISIKEIAFETGFSSESNFIVAFHNKIGVTPGEFRNTAF